MQNILQIQGEMRAEGALLSLKAIFFMDTHVCCTHGLRYLSVLYTIVSCCLRIFVVVMLSSACVRYAGDYCSVQWRWWIVNALARTCRFAGI